MNRIFTIARRAATVLVLAALGAAALSSCKPEKKDPVKLNAPQPSLSASTINSLAFTWAQVANAAQYTYELLSSDGSQAGNGSTSGTTAEFTGLKDNTAYTFKVVACPATGSEEYLESAAGQCVGTTSAITQLSTPVLKVEVAELTATISWNAVANAESYVYSFAADGGASGTTAETSVTFELDPGKYTFTLYATTKNEAFTDSEKASTEFEITKPEKKEAWSAEGTVSDGAGKTWESTLVAWEDGSYTIKKWYGTEGYDLEFTVNENTTITVTNIVVSEDGYNYVAADADNWIAIDTNYYEGYGAYSNFSGDKDSGEVYLWSYETGGWYDFVWPVGSGDQGGDEGGDETGESVTVDQLVGTYTQSNTYQFWYNGAWGNYESTNDVIIAKVDDKTVSIEGFMYATNEGGKVINATLDSEKGVLTIDPQMLTEYYKLAGQSAETNSVTVVYKGGTLTFGKWSLWYDGYAYAYSTKSTLTKK